MYIGFVEVGVGLLLSGGGFVEMVDCILCILYKFDDK